MMTSINRNIRDTHFLLSRDWCVLEGIQMYIYIGLDSITVKIMMFDECETAALTDIIFRSVILMKP